MEISTDILTLVGGIRTSLGYLKAVHTAPKDLDVLINEVSDCTAVYREVDSVIRGY
jgi:hypothetical protein